MQKITAKDFGAIPTSHSGCPQNPVITKILQLKVGEGFIIEKKDWTLRSIPSRQLAQYAARHQIKFSTKTLPQDKGWAVLRTK